MRTQHSFLAALLAVGVFASPYRISSTCDEHTSTVAATSSTSTGSVTLQHEGHYTGTAIETAKSDVPTKTDSTTKPRKVTVTVIETVIVIPTQTPEEPPVVTVTKTVSTTTTSKVTTTVTPPAESSERPSETKTESTSSSTSTKTEPKPSPSNRPPITDALKVDPETYKHLVIEHHNYHRANHSAPDIVWDDEIAKTALKIAQTCVYEHNMDMDGGGYGQNIAAGSPPANISAVITEGFYNGEFNAFEPHFGEATPSDIEDRDAFGKYGHLSALVWAGTTRVGCATHVCEKLENVSEAVRPFFTVCNYKATGNVIGAFKENVGLPLKRPTVHWHEGLTKAERQLLEGN